MSASAATRSARKSKLKTRKVVEAIRRVGKGPCSLCPRPAVSVVTWFPTDSCHRRLGTAPGRDRSVLIPLCQRHTVNLEESMSVAQEAIMAAAEIELAKPGSN